VRLFPPLPVLQGKQSDSEYLSFALSAPRSSDTVVREIILEFLSTANPAFEPYRVLFDDLQLKTESPYIPMVQGWRSSSHPAAVHTSRTDAVRVPLRSHKGLSDVIERSGQLHSKSLGPFLPEDLLERLQLALDVLEEEQSLRGLGPGPSDVLRFDRDTHRKYLGYSEYAAFSQDADWMSNVVLIAKSAYVWLFQLSRKYQRDIRLLSDIPDQELDNSPPGDKRGVVDRLVGEVIGVAPNQADHGESGSGLIGVLDI